MSSTAILVGFKRGARRFGSNVARLRSSRRLGQAAKGVAGLGVAGTGIAAYSGISSRGKVKPGSYREHLRNNVLAGKIQLNELSPKDLRSVRSTKIFKKITKNG